MLADRYTDFRGKQFGGYTLTNENPNIMRNLIYELAPNNMLAVTGGGEPLLFGPVALGVRTHGVDRAFNSNLATMIKGTLVERHGAGAKRIIARGEPYFWELVEAEVFPCIPKPLTERLSEPRTGKYIPPRQAMKIGAWSFERFTKIWASVPDYTLDAARDNMGCLSLACADIYEIRGCYDVVHLSNIPTFAGKKLDVEWLKATVKPAGHLIVTNPQNESLSMHDFAITWSETEPYPDSNGTIKWTYSVHQFTGEPVAA